jgi:hypothetical protein
LVLRKWLGDHKKSHFILTQTKQTTLHPGRPPFRHWRVPTAEKWSTGSGPISLQRSSSATEREHPSLLLAGAAIPPSPNSSIVKLFDGAQF